MHTLACIFILIYTKSCVVVMKFGANVVACFALYADVCVCCDAPIRGIATICAMIVGLYKDI